MLVELAEYWCLLHRKVCNTWRDMIKTSTALQYHIELAIAGMVNGPPGAVSTMERSQAELVARSLRLCLCLCSCLINNMHFSVSIYFDFHRESAQNDTGTLLQDFGRIQKSTPVNVPFHSVCERRNLPERFDS